MKKTSYHVNPAVNKWEEDQRRMRMEKMINRAKSTLPPEARAAGKASAKKPSPYAAELAARNPGARKQSSSGAAGGAKVPVAALMDVNELDNLIYQRLQDILGIPLVRQAAGRGASGTPPRPPLGRGRRPAWNEDWQAPPSRSPPQNWDERTVGGSAGKPVRPNPYNPYQSSSAPGTTATRRAGGTPTRSAATHRNASPPPLRLPAGQPPVPPGGPRRANSSNAMMQSNAGGERVVLLPSPSGASPGGTGSGTLGRTSSSRYGEGEGGGDPTRQSHGLLERSTVSAIATLNPAAPAAQQAAARVAAAGKGSGGGAGAHVGHAWGADGEGVGGTLGQSRRLSGSNVSTSGAMGRAGDGAANRSLASLSAASPGPSAGTPSAKRPPLAPRASASAPSGSPYEPPPSARASAPSPGARSGRASGGGEAEDEYGDEEFDEYEDDFEEAEEGGGEQEAAEGEEAEGQEDEGGTTAGGRSAAAAGGRSGGVSASRELSVLRQSLGALNSLVQMKLQEVSRSHASLRSHARSAAAGDEEEQEEAEQEEEEEDEEEEEAEAEQEEEGDEEAAASQLLASMALVGAEGGTARSSLMADGLQQSDLDYLDRLGGDRLGGSHLDPGHSHDDAPFVVEAGAPAGKTKAWGDRQPWQDGGSGTADTTGLEALRARQEKERLRAEREQAQAQTPSRRSTEGPQPHGPGHGEPARASLARSSGQGLGQGQGLAVEARQSQSRSRTGSTAGEEADSVLLGETVSPSRRTGGGGAQIAAMGTALAALASTSRLSVEEKKELKDQTSALYGSLVQLHKLMSGPRGAELIKSPSIGAARESSPGFTPTHQSPSHSPSHAASAARGSTSSSGGFGGGGAAALAAAALASDPAPAFPSSLPRPAALPPLKARESGVGVGVRESSGGAGPSGAGAGGYQHGAHVELTPKNRLVAEDVAWMAGLVDTLSRSLAFGDSHGDLPGL
ncbi:hypothetical protein HYH03_009286 [Edaphochlamys debaryana]|uniref:Uncharacterized protein n=1 Tax=Edaphochlamys debaryana TaxID=47281 RepID=A0A835Y1G9_9CHLO|nr:hypothetical protein HYH03_009286 [Edaphochlamys debaryana]|eukprot:KAG2492336.1 hypothetical protein HYH03_009286 [Edaphochlamys debaryana]